MRGSRTSIALVVVSIVAAMVFGLDCWILDERLDRQETTIRELVSEREADDRQQAVREDRIRKCRDRYVASWPESSTTAHRTSDCMALSDADLALAWMIAVSVDQLDGTR